MKMYFAKIHLNVQHSTYFFSMNTTCLCWKIKLFFRISKNGKLSIHCMLIYKNFVHFHLKIFCSVNWEQTTFSCVWNFKIFFMLVNRRQNKDKIEKVDFCISADVHFSTNHQLAFAASINQASIINQWVTQCKINYNKK